MKEDEIQEYDNRQDIYLNAVINAQKKIDRYKKICDAYSYYMGQCQIEAKLIRSLANDFQDDRMYMAIFAYLYRNGYLSFDKSFEFGIDEEEIDCNMGLSVITGKGVCRNIAAHFKDVLRAIKHQMLDNSKTFFVGTNINEERDIVLPLNELPKEFKIKYAHASKNNEGLSNNRQSEIEYKFLPNHAEIIVMVHPDTSSKLMMYDPTNIRITEIDFSKRTNERRAIDLRSEIWDVSSDLLTLKDREEHIKRFGRIASRLEISNFKQYPKEDMKLILEYARRSCNKNIGRIEDFYKKSERDYSIIKKQKEKYYRICKQEDKGRD